MTRYQQNREIAWRAIDGEAVLFDSVAGMMRQLNPVGTALWAQLEQQRTVEDLVAFVTQRYEVPADRAQADVQAFLASLLERKLLVEGPG